MNDYDADQLRNTIARYREELDYVQTLLDPVRKLMETVLVVEEILKTHFTPSDVEKPTLGPLLHSRKTFLGRELFTNVAFAIDVRNRISHHDPRGRPTDTEYGKASEVLCNVIELHCRELENQLPNLESSQHQGASSTQESSTESIVQTVDASPPAGTAIYATQIERRPTPMLDAGNDDPHVSASTLAEYSFCPRAGILTHEGGYSDPEEELPSFGLLPWYEQDSIEEAYTHALYVLFAMPVGLVALVVVLSLFALGNVAYPFLLIALLGGWSIAAWRAYLRWRELGERRLAARLATVCDPVPGKNAFQPVNWWGLLLAGYEVRRPDTAMHDERWKLSGKPRRILQKGSLRIPVHRIRNPEGPILPQHIVRVMAHCHLLEATEGANSPFAIVLFGNTYEGMTVPNTHENRERFYTAIGRVRATIIESDARERDPPEPVTGNLCSGCHYGRPRPISLEDKTMRYGDPVAPFRLHNAKKIFHCDCGDRFRWKPAHDATQKLHEHK